MIKSSKLLQWREYNKRQLRRSIGNYNIQNFDKRLFSKHFGHLHYDKHQNIKLDEYLFDRAIHKEESIASKFNKAINQEIIDKMEAEIASRTDSRPVEFPEKLGDFYYKSMIKHNQGKSYNALYRSVTENGKYSLIFDPVKDRAIPDRAIETYELVKMQIDDTGNYLGVMIDIDSNELPRGVIKDIKKNRLYKDKIKNCVTMEFMEGGDSIIYIRRDGISLRNNKLVYHKIGDFTFESDQEVLNEEDESVWLDLALSSCKSYFVLFRVSHSGQDYFLADRRGVSDPQDLKFVKIAGRKDEITNLTVNKKGMVFSRQDELYFIPHSQMVEGLGSSNFTEDFSIDKKFGQPQKIELGGNIEGQEDGKFNIKDFDFTENYIVIYASRVANSKVLYSIFGQSEEAETSSFSIPPLKEISFSENQYGLISPGVNQSPSSNLVRFHFDSPFVFDEVFNFFPLEESIQQLKPFQLNGKQFKADRFQITEVRAPSADGTMIPMTLIHRKGDIQKKGDYHFYRGNGPKKLLISNYGCYGLDHELDFSMTDWCLLERDWVLAFAHIRGGKELGNQWQKSANQATKVKSATDLLDCCSYLVAEGITHPSLLCASSYSAGSTILAAAVNMRPNMFKGVHHSVPFLDLRASLLDKDLPLSQSDYAEFGNPLENEIDYIAVSSLCPYENLKESEYPAVYIQANDSDQRTPLNNVLKYSTKFREVVKVPTRVSEFVEKNIVVEVNQGSHHGTGDRDDMNSQFLRKGAFFEWLIEEKSRDLSFN